MKLKGREAETPAAVSRRNSLGFAPEFEVIATGSCLPKKIVSSRSLAERLGIDAGWIVSRTGIVERRHVEEPENTVLLARQAAKSAIDRAGVDPAHIGLIVVATSSPDKRTPSTAASIQSELGLGSAWAFDVSAGCSGFLYALKAASGILKTSALPYALVIGAESLSRHIDWTDRKSSVLFGDGAGAVVIKSKSGGGIRDPFYLQSCSDCEGHLFIGDRAQDGPALIRMNGREVFRQAVSRISESVARLMARLDLEAEDIQHFVVHQANARIVESVKSRLGFGDEQIPGNIERLGNTGAASIPILLHETAVSGRLRKNDLILLSAFGAGFTWGSAALVW